jgi:prepilin-type N-terminal cleavage/methylation domain-containing protein
MKNFMSIRTEGGASVYRPMTIRSHFDRHFCMARKSEGFSLLELMVVVAICLIVVATAIPTFLTAYYNIRIKNAVTDLSGLMQRARILAAKNNAVYTIAYRTSGGVQEAFVDENLNGAWDTGEPLITFNSAVTIGSGPPTGTGGQPTPYVLVGDTSGTTYSNTTTLGYSNRGLPCAYSGGTCTTPAPGYFVYYITEQDPSGTNWAAVVVTRGGRTKAVVWNGTTWN